MVRIQPVNFRMNYTIEFCTYFRGTCWTPEIGKRVICFKDNCSEALDHDTHAIGVYKKFEEQEEKRKLVGHVPIECSSLMDYFLTADSSNKLIATVEGKRKREVGWSLLRKVHMLYETTSES